MLLRARTPKLWLRRSGIQRCRVSQNGLAGSVRLSEILMILVSALGFQVIFGQFGSGQELFEA